MSSRPKILLIALEVNWPGVARLPRALQEAGFTVGVACRAGAFLTLTKFRDHFFQLPKANHGRGLLAAIRSIVRAWPPDLIMPVDDQTALFLAQLHEQLAGQAPPDGLADLLRRSLGNPAGILEATSKRRTIAAAHGLGLRVPARQPITSVADILEFGRTNDFPIVLKRSFDGGGNGVLICRNENEVVAAAAWLRRSQKAGGRASRWHKVLYGRQLGDRWLPADRSHTVNQYITGRCATLLAAAKDGRMLAALTAIKEESYPDEKGPSSVVRFVRVEEMRRTAEIMLRHWRLTGLVGFDFMLDAAGRAWLIECNPRPTQMAHLGGKAGENLCAALHASLAGIPAPPMKPENGLLVAYFPKEIWRDPQSPYLTSAFHDVPVDDVELLNAIKQIVPGRPQAFSNERATG